MIKHSVRWRSDTIMVKIGKYFIPRVIVFGEYFIRAKE